jgi:hypothetical protein
MAELILTAIQSTLVERGKAAFASAAAADTTRYELLKEVASIVVELRSTSVGSDGSIDWLGKAQNTRDLAGLIYNSLELSDEQRGKFMAACRYHVGLELERLGHKAAPSKKSKDEIAADVAAKEAKAFVKVLGETMPHVVIEKAVARLASSPDEIVLQAVMVLNAIDVNAIPVGQIADVVASLSELSEKVASILLRLAPTQVVAA